MSFLIREYKTKDTYPEQNFFYLKNKKLQVYVAISWLHLKMIVSDGVLQVENHIDLKMNDNVIIALMQLKSMVMENYHTAKNTW